MNFLANPIAGVIAALNTTRVLLVKKRQRLDIWSELVVSITLRSPPKTLSIYNYGLRIFLPFSLY